MENLNIALTHRNAGWASTVKWKAVLEARDYVSSVTLENIYTVTQEELNAYDLVVNSYEVYTTASQSVLRGITAPILNLNHRGYSVLKIGTNYSARAGQTDIKIDDNTHDITSIYDLNEDVTVQESNSIGGLISPPEDMDVLAEALYGSYSKTLCAMDVGGLFLDSFVNTSKFVHFGLYYLDATHDITADGLTLLDRICAWLMGEYDARTLTIESSGAANVAIEVSVTDEDGKKDGTTNFTRRYFEDVELVLTAPATAGSLVFQKWTYDGSDSFDLGLELTTASENKTALVTYAVLDYEEIVEFDVRKREREFSVKKRPRAFSINKRERQFNVKRRDQ